MPNPILDAIDSLAEVGPHRWTASSRPEVMQGRATYGGVPAGWCLRAMDAAAGAERRCRSMQLSFVGPVTADPVEVTVDVLRSGRSATHLQVRVVQNDEVRVTALAVYGADRPSQVRVPAPTRPALPAPDACLTVPYIAGVMPRMTEFVGFALAEPRVPFSSQADADVLGHVRFPRTEATIDAGILAALVDAWWPPILPMLTSPAPTSSVTWSLEFPTAPTAHRASDWFAFAGGARAAAHGYASCHGDLFAPDGTCVAISRQLVAVFDQR